MHTHSVGFFVGEISHAGGKKKKNPGESNKRLFENSKKRKSPYLEKKKARSRQI